LLRGATDDDTKKLRAYLLGLALVSFTKPAVGFLRQGCNLVLDSDKTPESKLVFPDGRREDARLAHDAVLAFAQKSAAVFGVGESKTVKFDTKLANDEMTGEGKKKKQKAKPK
jgi:CRISPR-associated protein Csb1